MVKVKICGITNADDALAACEAGADALGFIFTDKSPRFIAPAKAGEIVQLLPPFVTKVGVFVNAEADFIRRTMENVGLNSVQLHGEEPPEMCSMLTGPVIKAFRMRTGFRMQEIQA